MRIVRRIDALRGGLGSQPPAVHPGSVCRHDDREARNGDRWRRRRNGQWAVKRTVLDLRLEAPPDAPITYLDMVVPHPCVATQVHGAATEYGHAASQAEAGKHTRYPANAHVRGRLVPFAVETYGRLGAEGLRFLRQAAGRACRRTTALVVLGGEEPPAVLGARLLAGGQRHGGERAAARRLRAEFE